MRTFDDILADITAALRPFMRELYDAGRQTGGDDVRAALSHFLHHVPAADEDIMPMPERSDTEIAAVIATEGRAAPGSVKPAILNAIRQSPGVTIADIRARTGAKPNSVRGTLWTLQKEELIERKGASTSPSGCRFPLRLLPKTMSFERTPNFETSEFPLSAKRAGNGNPGATNAGARLTRQPRRDLHHVAHGPEKSVT